MRNNWKVITLLLLLLGYIAYNEYRLWDYEHVRYDAIISVHYPDLVKKAQEGKH